MTNGNFCPNCGNKIDNDSEFCSNCGEKIKNQSQQPKDNTNTNTNNNFINNILSNPKLIILPIIVIVLLISICSLTGVFNNDIVDVTSIEMSVGYYDTPFGGAIESAKYPSNTNHQDYQVGSAITKFSFMPKETITRVTGLVVTNIEVTLKNGQTEKWGNAEFNPNDKYFKDTNYDFKITHQLKGMGKNIDEYYSISHIKADIVMNTTDKQNVVIGHINEDITPSHY